MTRYRQKPVTYEAEQWFPGNGAGGILDSSDLNDMQLWAANDLLQSMGLDTVFESGEYGYKLGERGFDVIFPGDWILTSDLGDVQRLTNATFRMYYEPIEEDLNE